MPNDLVGAVIRVKGFKNYAQGDEKQQLETVNERWDEVVQFLDGEQS